MLATAAGHLAPEDIDYMARLMLDAERAKQPYPDIARLNPALNDEALFAVQHRFVAHHLETGKQIGGFKGDSFRRHRSGGPVQAKLY